MASLCVLVGIYKGSQMKVSEVAFLEPHHDIDNRSMWVEVDTVNPAALFLNLGSKINIGSIKRVMRRPFSGELYSDGIHQTFTVIAIEMNKIKITPSIVIRRPYANCSGMALNGDEITLFKAPD